MRFGSERRGIPGLDLSCGDHLHRGDRGVPTDLAFPNTNPSPPCLREHSVGGQVACAIGSELLTPADGVRSPKLSWSVLWTVVPETAVDEYGDSMPRQDEIWAVATDPTIQSEPESLSMHSCAQSQLRLGVARRPSTKVSSLSGGLPRRGLHSGRSTGCRDHDVTLASGSGGQTPSM